MKKMMLVVVSAGLLVLLSACGQTEVKQTAKVTIGGESGNGFPFSLKAATLIGKADVLDGAEDKVVSKCAGCALGMNGSEDHQLNVGEYKMNFCSKYCRDEFDKDTETKILAMEIPGGSP